MTIDAEVQFTKPYPEFGIQLNEVVIVTVDEDYVEADEADIAEYVGNELEDLYGKAFPYQMAYEILNIEDIMTELGSRHDRYGSDDDDEMDEDNSY